MAVTAVAMVEEVMVVVDIDYFLLLLKSCVRTDIYRAMVVV